MSQPTSYEGACHCKKVRFRASTDLAMVVSCNCSICSKAGTLLTFVPIENFELLSGADDLAEYRFHTKTIAHQFCKTCGIRPFARGKKKDGSEVRAINVRCLENVDIDSLTVTAVDGKSL